MTDPNIPKPRRSILPPLRKPSPYDRNGVVINPPGLAIRLGIFAVVLIFSIIMLTGITNVGATERAVVFERDGDLRILQPGKFQYVAPIVNTVTKYDVRETTYTETAIGISLDLQETTTEVTVRYSPDPASIQTIHQTLGTAYEAKVVVPAVQRCVKDAVSNYNVEQLTGAIRAKVNDDIARCITDDLKSSNLLVARVSVTDFDFSAQFNQAIEAKAIAQQRAQEERNKLEQVIYQANQTRVQAQAQADAAHLLAQSTSGEQGQAYLFLEWLKAWQAGGSQVPQILSGGESTPFLVTIPPPTATPAK